MTAVKGWLSYKGKSKAGPDVDTAIEHARRPARSLPTCFFKSFMSISSNCYYMLTQNSSSSPWGYVVPCCLQRWWLSYTFWAVIFNYEINDQLCSFGQWLIRTTTHWMRFMSWGWPAQVVISEGRRYFNPKVTSAPLNNGLRSARLPEQLPLLR